MGRELRRVPFDFAWPLGKVWGGYVRPARFEEVSCPDCSEGLGVGYAPRAKQLFSLWYGYAPFKPGDNGSVSFTIEHPVVRGRAERNIASAPEYYGEGEQATRREAWRLAVLFNGSWGHHLNADDVAALIEADRLWDFTRHWVKGEGWVDNDPVVIPTPQEVNDWSVDGVGHDSSSAHLVIKARCKREGVSRTCPTCDGYGSTEAYPGQREESEDWEWIEPPTGPGYQLWETTSEGSPKTPVYETIEELCVYAAANVSTFGSDMATAEQWREMLDENFVHSEYVAADGSRMVFL